ncbi:hypothetical protein P4V40_18095, partial [Brevibacillus laterosporus]|uniref:hypothetical protein n=1 Tax=Brevibacillus laterosporus TaxID=1465 RepID=UPI002E211CE2|nr:hypothetical protein [Brevibacillus laterosporus]
PVAPVAPVEPVGPVAPVAPVEPVGPVAPVAPVEPVEPVEPVAPVGQGIHVIGEQVVKFLQKDELEEELLQRAKIFLLLKGSRRIKSDKSGSFILSRISLMSS